MKFITDIIIRFSWRFNFWNWCISEESHRIGRVCCKQASRNKFWRNLLENVEDNKVFVRIKVLSIGRRIWLHCKKNSK